MFYLLLTWVGLLVLFAMMLHCELVGEETAAEAEGDCFIGSSVSGRAVLQRLSADSHDQLMNCCLKEAKITTRPTRCRSVVDDGLTSQSRTQSLE